MGPLQPCRATCRPGQAASVLKFSSLLMNFFETSAATWDFPIIGEYKFANMTELRKMSRLWGGMHFTDSYELCDGVGAVGYHNLMVPLMGAGGDYAEFQLDDKEKLF